MREKHPIDEHFKKALFHAEATPPDVVRNALAHELGWVAGTRTTVGMWPILIIMLGLVSAGTAVWSWERNNNEASTQQAELTMVDHRSVNRDLLVLETGTGKADVNDTLPSAAVPSLRAQEAVAGLDPLRREAKSAPLNAARVRPSDYTEPLADALDNAPQAGPYTIKATNTTSTVLEVGIEGRPKKVLVVDKGSQGSVQNDVVVKNHADVAAMGLLFENRSVTGALSTDGSNTRAFYMAPIELQGVPGQGTIGTRPPSEIYVLPKGVWWIGPYIGFGAVKGEWRGDRVADLQRAEKWRSTAQAGLLAGREWRSGWGVSAGIGISNVRSTFHYERVGEASNFTEVDTTWAQSDIFNIPIYTWNIDTVESIRPGNLEQLDARNSYTAVNIPVNLSWQGNVRRFKYGGSIGLMAWIPSQRKGMTLVHERTDSPPSTVALQDNKVQDRFGVQVHGTAALSVGYSLNELMSIHVEPMLVTPLLGTNASGSPWLTRPMIQVRLQYELR